MAKKQTWAEMDKSNIPLDKLIEGFARSLAEMIGRSDSQACISRLHPHRLRHTFATPVLDAKARRYVSLASVQRAIVENRPSGMDQLGRNIAGHAATKRVHRTRP